MHYLCSEKGNSHVALEIFKILLGQCYDAKDSRDLNKKTPMDYAEEAGNTEIVQYCKSVTHVLFSRDF